MANGRNSAASKRGIGNVAREKPASQSVPGRDHMATMPSTVDEYRNARSILLKKYRRAVLRDDRAAAARLRESIDILTAEIARQS